MKTSLLVVIILRVHKCNRHVTRDEFAESQLSRCFIPIGGDSFLVLKNAELPPIPEHCVGWDPFHKNAELFRFAPDGGAVAVGNHGTVLSLSVIAISHPYPTYCSIRINRDGYRVISGHYGAPSFRVARLVALCWCDRGPGDTEVDHIDRNKSNDNANNLRWCSHADNARNAVRKATHRWSDKDYVVLLPIARQFDQVLCIHPSQVTRISGSTNASHVLVRKTRKTLNGWLPLLNASLSDIMDACKEYHLLIYFAAAVNAVSNYRLEACA